MKHLHFDVETAGFYGAYWACAGGSDCAVIAMIGDDPEDRLARSAVKWLCGRGVNVLTMSPAKKDYGHHNYPLERMEAAISWLKANGNKKIGIAGASTTGTLALTAAAMFDREVTMELNVRDTPEMISSAAILSGFTNLFAEKLLLLEGKTLADGGSIEIRQ